MKNYFLVTIILLAGLFATATAQEVRSITLEQAVEIALENNIGIQLSLSDIDRSESELRQSRAEFYPNLNASISGARVSGRQFDQASITFDDITSHNINAGITSNVILFNGFQNINQLRSSQVGMESAELRYQRTREQIIFEAASRFLEVLLTEELLEIEMENLEVSRKQLEQVIAQVEVGMSPIVEQYSQEAIIAGNEVNVIRRENSLNIAKLRLARWLQLDPLADYNFEAPGIEEEEFLIQEYNLGEMVEFAIATRRDIRASELDLQQTRYALKVSEGNRLPEVSLSGSITTAYRDQQRRPVANGGGSEVIPFSDQFFDGNINRRIGFNVSIPIFNRWQISNQIQQRKIDYRDAELRFQDLQQEIYLELRQAFNDYTAYVQELEATEKALIAAEKAYETEQERYNVGSATLIELTNANNAYVQASSNRVRVMYQFIFQERVLDYFLGRISDEYDLNTPDY